MNNTNQTAATVLTPVQQAIAAAQAGNKPLARLHLENAVAAEHKNPDYWVWLAWTAESPISTISALQHALTLEPNHTLAQQGLAWASAMRDFDLNSYSESVTEATTTATPSESQASTDAEDGGPGALEPEADVAEAPEVEAAHVERQVEPTSSAKVEETQPADEPVIEVEQVDHEPVAAEPTVELEADVEAAKESTFDEPTIEPAEAQDAVSDVDQVEAAPNTEPLEAELVDVGQIDSEVFAAADQAGSEAQAPVSEGIILAVDDSPTIRKIVSMSLEAVGYKVVTAADGMEAMQQLPKCNPALILTDISMPKIDGYQLCKLIKAHEKTKTIPVIMLSGKDGMFDKIKGKFVGCDDYITKPFQSAELLEKVSAYLPAPVSDS